MANERDIEAVPAKTFKSLIDKVSGTNAREREIQAEQRMYQQKDVDQGTASLQTLQELTQRLTELLEQTKEGDTLFAQTRGNLLEIYNDMRLWDIETKQLTELWDKEKVVLEKEGKDQEDVLKAILRADDKLRQATKDLSEVQIEKLDPTMMENDLMSINDNMVKLVEIQTKTLETMQSQIHSFEIELPAVRGAIEDQSKKMTGTALVPAPKITPTADYKAGMELAETSAISSQIKGEQGEVVHRGIKYSPVQFDVEWEEAKRYPEFEKMGKENWIKLAKTGKAITVDDALSDIIDNTEAGTKYRHTWDELEEPKKERFNEALKSDKVELPLIARYEDGRLELVAGNTRLTGLMNAVGEGKAWVFDIPSSINDKAVKDVSTALVPVPKITPPADYDASMGLAETSAIRRQIKSTALVPVSPVPKPGGPEGSNMSAIQDFLHWGALPRQSTEVTEATAASAEREDQQDEEAHRGIMRRMFDNIADSLGDLAGKGKKVAKAGIIATLTALGLIWLLKFMETDTWKDIASAVTDFINTGLPIIVKTIGLIVDTVVGFFTGVKWLWDHSFGWVLNKIGKYGFGMTRDVEEVDENGKTVIKQVGWLGDGIGLLIVALAGLALAVKVTALAMHPWKTLGKVGGGIGKLFGGGAGGAGGAGGGGIPPLGGAGPTMPGAGGPGRGGGWTSKLAKGAKNLGKGIADLGKGIGRGLGKLIELTLKGLAAGLKALGNTRVLKGAVAMGILGLAMIPFAIAINKFSKANWKGLGIAITGMAAMTAAVFVLGKVGPHVLIGAAAMVALGLAMIPLSIAMQKFSTIDWVSIPKGITALVAFSAAVGVLGAAMMTGIGAMFFGAGVAAIAALGAGLLVFGAGAKAMAKGVNDIIPAINRLTKLDSKKLLKVEPALKAVASGLWAFSKSSLGSSFLGWIGKLFGKNSGISNIQELAKSAPNIALLSRHLLTLGNLLKEFGQKTSGFKADQVKDFIDALDHDEASDMLALGKMFEGMGQVDWLAFRTNLDGLGASFKNFGETAKSFNPANIKQFLDSLSLNSMFGTTKGDVNAISELFGNLGTIAWGSMSKFFEGGFKNLELPNLEEKLVNTYIKFFNKLIEVFDKWPNNFAWPGAVPMESAGTAPVVRRQPVAAGGGVVVPRASTTVDADGVRKTVTQLPNGTTRIETTSADGKRRSVETARDWQKIAGEDWAPGQDLSKKQYGMLSMSVSMGNKLPPERQKAYDKYEGKPTAAPTTAEVLQQQVAAGVPLVDQKGWNKAKNEKFSKLYTTKRLERDDIQKQIEAMGPMDKKSEDYLKQEREAIRDEGKEKGLAWMKRYVGEADMYSSAKKQRKYRRLTRKERYAESAEKSLLHEVSPYKRSDLKKSVDTAKKRDAVRRQLADAGGATDWDSVIKKSLASGKTLSYKEFEKLHKKHGDFDTAGDLFDSWSAYQLALKGRQLAAADLTKGTLVGGKLVAAPKVPGPGAGQSAAREDKSRAIGVKVTALRATHGRLQTLADNDPRIQQREDFMKKWGIDYGSYERGIRGKGAFKKVDGKSTWVSEAKKGWREEALSSGLFESYKIQFSDSQKIKPSKDPLMVAARGAKENLELEEKRLTASMYGRDYDIDSAEIYKRSPVGRRRYSSILRQDFERRYHGQGVSQSQLKDQKWVLEKLGYDTDAMKTEAEINEAFIKERNKYIQPPAKKAPDLAPPIDTGKVDKTLPRNLLGKSVFVSPILAGGPISDLLSAPNTSKSVGDKVQKAKNLLKQVSSLGKAPTYSATVSLGDSDAMKLNEHNLMEKSIALLAKRDLIFNNAEDSSAMFFKDAADWEKMGTDAGDLMREAKASYFKRTGLTPPVVPMPKGAKSIDWESRPQITAKPLKITAKKIQASQTDLANVQQVAAGIGKSDVNIGGSPVQNIDNSQRNTYNVGKSSLTPDIRMLGTVSKDF